MSKNMVWKITDVGSKLGKSIKNHHRIFSTTSTKLRLELTGTSHTESDYENDFVITIKNLSRTVIYELNPKSSIPTAAPAPPPLPHPPQVTRLHQLSSRIPGNQPVRHEIFSFHGCWLTAPSNYQVASLTFVPVMRKLPF